ncbi:MAG: hypothetical protein M1401_03490 [Chloroflexi bacterium]|nr:hypothetical protein [Chloroflexota bacterium]MCL5107930.1 hypothetical protein [Chloroflexota bacterium]
MASEGLPEPPPEAAAEAAAGAPTAPQPPWTGTAWDYPELRQALARLVEGGLDLADKKLEGNRAAAVRATDRVLWLAGGVVLVVVIPVSLLTAFGRMSAEAAAFLYGVVVGAAFTFLRDFFPKT